MGEHGITSAEEQAVSARYARIIRRREGRDVQLTLEERRIAWAVDDMLDRVVLRRAIALRKSGGDFSDPDATRPPMNGDAPKDGDGYLDHDGRQGPATRREAVERAKARVAAEERRARKLFNQWKRRHRAALRGPVPGRFD